MAVHEIVMRRPDRDDEIRLTDQAPMIGSTLKIDGQPYTVESTAPSPRSIDGNRYVCVPTAIRSHQPIRANVERRPRDIPRAR
jgi:hypothetical protein